MATAPSPSALWARFEALAEAQLNEGITRSDKTDKPGVSEADTVSETPTEPAKPKLAWFRRRVRASLHCCHNNSVICSPLQITEGSEDQTLPRMVITQPLVVITDFLAEPKT